MPYYKTSNLAKTVGEVEANGETVVAVVREQGPYFAVVTVVARNDTGEPWLPSWAKGA